MARPALFEPLDPLRGVVEDRRDLVQPVLVRVVASHAVPQGGEKVADGTADRRAARLLILFAKAGEAGDQRVDLVLALGEMRLALGRDGEGLARALGRLLLDQPHVLEHGEGRVDDSRARRIGAPGHLLDRADEVVAVARLVRDQLEEDEPELARIEHAPRASAAAAPAPAAAAPIAPVAGAEAVPAARAHAHRENPCRNVEAAGAAASAHPEPHDDALQSISVALRYIL